jgi:hypothetical protein
VLMAIERGGGALYVTDLGDCRSFALDRHQHRADR